MKFLIKYKLFLEEAEFDIQDTDSVDVKMSKDGLNTLKLNLTEYKTKKPLIDKLYSEVKDPNQIETQLKTILGTTDIQNGRDRNSFLVEYSNLSKLKSDLDTMQKQNVDDKVKLDDFQEELRYAKEQSTKDVVNKKITDINKRMSDRKTQIQKIQNDFAINLKVHTNKMAKIQKDSEEYIKKISNVIQK
jgi:hypothetical protein